MNVNNNKNNIKTETKKKLATTSSSSPSSPKQQPQSLSSSGEESLNNTVASENENDNNGLTNGKSSETNEPSETKDESSFQNAGAIRTSRLSTNDSDYENTMKATPDTNGLNGSNRNSTIDNNNTVKTELVNGNSVEARKNSIENSYSVANATGNNNNKKDELYDVPEGECHAYLFQKHYTK